MLVILREAEDLLLVLALAFVAANCHHAYVQEENAAIERPRSLLDIMDSFSMPGLAEIDFDPPRLDLSIQPADFSECSCPTPTSSSNDAKLRSAASSSLDEEPQATIEPKV